ncbi:MAG: hypothetical protein NVS3B17_12490 [Vulcanimicrobiaceae bacterium]
MQALARATQGVGGTAPRGRLLYGFTFICDLASNGAYFALVATGGRTVKGTLALGAGLGLLAGIGAVVLPRPLGLTSETTSRTSSTALQTIALYTAGGLAAAAPAISQTAHS